MKTCITFLLCLGVTKYIYVGIKPTRANDTSNKEIEKRGDASNKVEYADCIGRLDRFGNICLFILILNSNM
jgi:hypothetical protein